MTEPEDRALDRHEIELVGQSRALTDLTDRQLAELVRLLRARRDRVQRMIRTRTRQAEGRGNPDTGAREKKAVLTEAIQRVAAEIKARKTASAAELATQHLHDAVRRKAENPTWTGPEQVTPHTPPAETPNTKIAPSGALHAEGMRAAISRTTGDR